MLGERIHQFKAECFGLCTAFQAFTRVFTVALMRAYQGGIHLHFYLDTWLIVVNYPSCLLEHHHFFLQLCQDLGIVINLEKSDLEPECSISWNAGRHHLREGISIEIWITRFWGCGEFSSFTCPAPGKAVVTAALSDSQFCPPLLLPYGWCQFEQTTFGSINK